MQGPTKGTNASGMRRHNERLLLSAIRRLGGASKTELARLTDLSPQAVVRIVDQMETDGLIHQAGKRTGGMGQPAIIYQINGARGYTVGVEIGRNGLVLALLDFAGHRCAISREETGFPSIASAVTRIEAFLDDHLGRSGQLSPSTFLGIGIAMPWFLGEWREELRLSPDQADEWKRPDVAERLRTALNWPVTFENDGNAATLAHLLIGTGKDLRDFLTIQLGTFVGGGLALGGQIIRGRHGNAGALASMPVAGPSTETERADYLVHHASLYTLTDDAQPEEKAAWTVRCAEKLAFVVIGTNSLLDLEAVIIDGALPPAMLGDLKAEIERRINADGPADFFKPEIRIGNFGSLAVATGAALLPLHSAFDPDFRTLFRSDNA